MTLYEQLAQAKAKVSRLERQLARERAGINPKARLVIGSGQARHVVPLATTPARQRGMAAELTAALFPTAGQLHKARRRGERALAESRA